MDHNTMLAFLMGQRRGGGSSGGGSGSGGGSDYWVPTDKNGEIWIGEEVASGAQGFGVDVKPTQLMSNYTSSRVYRVTIDGTAYVCLKSKLDYVTAGGVISFKYMNKGYWIVTFTDGMPHTLSVESWVPQVTELG